jgi:hypothetical protein
MQEPEKNAFKSNFYSRVFMMTGNRSIRLQPAAGLNGIESIEILNAAGRRVFSIKCTAEMITGSGIVLPIDRNLGIGLYFVKTLGESSVMLGRFTLVR